MGSKFNDSIVFLIEEDLKKDYKEEIKGNAVKLDEANVRRIYEKHQESQGYKC